MSPQGPRLRAYFKIRGVKLVAAAYKLGVHVNTLQNWLKSSELELKVFSNLAEHWPDIMDEFPEVEWRRIPTAAMEPSMSYMSRADSACLDRLANLNQRYIALLEKYLLLKEQLAQ